jgi:transketolase
MEFVGVQDRYGESGKWDEVLEMMGLTAENIAAAARSVIARKAG